MITCTILSLLLLAFNPTNAENILKNITEDIYSSKTVNIKSDFQATITAFPGAKSIQSRLNVPSTVHYVILVRKSPSDQPSFCGVFKGGVLKAYPPENKENLHSDALEYSSASEVTNTHSIVKIRSYLEFLFTYNPTNCTKMNKSPLTITGILAYLQLSDYSCPLAHPRRISMKQPSTGIDQILCLDKYEDQYVDNLLTSIGGKFVYDVVQARTVVDRNVPLAVFVSLAAPFPAILIILAMLATIIYLRLKKGKSVKGQLETIKECDDEAEV